MRKILFFILIIDLVFASLFRKDKLNLVWVGYDKSYEKVVNILVNTLKEDYNVRLIKVKDKALLSLINYYDIYSNPVKLKDGLNADKLINRLDNYIVIFNITNEGEKFVISGVKYQKNNDKIYKLTLSKKIKKIKDLYNLLYFYIYSDIPDYAYVDRSKSSPIVYVNKKELLTEYYTQQKVILFKKPVNTTNIELAKKLNLVSKTDNIAEVARDYCNLNNLDVANKVFVTDEEISYEDYFSIIDFKNGFNIYKKINPVTNKSEFRCIGRESKRVMQFENFILNKIGLYEVKDSYFYYNRNLIADYPYAYIFKDAFYRIDLNHNLFYLDKKILEKVNNAILIDYNHLIAYDNNYMYDIKDKNIVNKIKVKNIVSIYKFKNYLIISNDIGNIFVFNNKLKLLRTIPQIGIFFYKFKNDYNYLYAYNANGFLYKFLIKKFIGE